MVFLEVFVKIGDSLKRDDLRSFKLLQLAAVHLLNIKGKTAGEPGHRQTSVSVGRHLRPGTSMDVETVGHIPLITSNHVIIELSLK